ncbi:MAG: glucosamine-6-phosphate deaminase, partial [Petrimonas sp.]|nr:glucosamine-6-phosphate deaminase [Petrimonas sp.]MEA5043367.1 glucosamine-6-phosphate deaminase [Petrimonas sp.]
CDYDACAELKVATYKYFLDIEHDNLDPESLL